MRISHRGDDFSAEHWAAVHAREAGAPAPDVLAVRGDIEVDHDRRVAIWIHRRIEGEPLHAIADSEAPDLTQAAGEALARIHSVPTEGFGYINGDGRGPHGQFSEFLRLAETEVQGVARSGVPESALDSAQQLIRGSEHLWLEPRLLHGDYLPEHVLAARGGITGVIDFGGTCSGDPAYDLAYWGFFHGFDGEEIVDATPTGALIEGYRRVADLGDHLRRRLDLCLMSKAVKHMSLYLNHDRIGPAEFCRKRFEEAFTRLAG